MPKNMIRTSARRETRPINKNCPYCKQAIEPTYKDAKSLSRYMTEKGKIVSRSKTGICNKHQGRMSVAIKRARQLALLPFVTVVQ